MSRGTEKADSTETVMSFLAHEKCQGQEVPGYVWLCESMCLSPHGQGQGGTTLFLSYYPGAAQRLRPVSSGPSDVSVIELLGQRVQEQEGTWSHLCDSYPL